MILLPVYIPYNVKTKGASALVFQIIPKAKAPFPRPPTRYSTVFLWISLRFSYRSLQGGRPAWNGKRHREDRQALPTSRRNLPFVEGDDLLRDGKPQPGSFRPALRIQPVELLEYPLQLFRRNRPAVVGKTKLHMIPALPDFDGNLRPLIAVGPGIGSNLRIRPRLKSPLFQKPIIGNRFFLALI